MILIVKHVDIEGPGFIADFFDNTKWETRIVELGGGDVLPSGTQGLEALIFLGGSMNVYEEDKYPFLKQEDEFLKEVLASDIPTLGICLGAQLIAKASGAKVTRARRSEIGCEKVLLTDAGKDDSLFEGLGPELEVLQWHDDAFDVPDKGVLLARSPVCPQAFRLKENIYGLQFHAEVTPQMIESWIGKYGSNGELPAGVKEDMLLQVYKKNNDFFMQCKRLLLNFSRKIDAG